MKYNFEKVFFEDNFLHLHWRDGRKNKHGYYFLRINCPCAHCVDEWSGKRILKEESIPQNITPLKSHFVGNYGLQIDWSDNHKTGIYTWELLYKLNKK
jgi:DUF971 family protein